MRGSLFIGGDGGIRSIKENVKKCENTIEIRRSDTPSVIRTWGVPKKEARATSCFRSH